VTENFIYRAAILFRAHTPPQRVARQAMASTNYAAVTTVYNRDKESRAVRSLAVDPSVGTERRWNTLLMRCEYQSYLPTLHIHKAKKTTLVYFPIYASVVFNIFLTNQSS
jgi:hypothetical protein